MPFISAPQVEQHRFSLFVLVVAVFVALLPVALWTAGRFSVRTYFLISFVWFLIVSEVFAPAEPETNWWRQLRWIKLLGVLVLCYIVAERVAVVVQ